jgi:two-component system nitrate/nitrite response regulator NarL
MTRVLLVDDHLSMLWGLRKLIESAGPGLELVGAVSTAAEVRDAVARLRPDVIVLDLDLGGGSDASLVSDLRVLSPARILLFTGCRDAALLERAVEAGASGLVQKSESAAVILKAIASVHAGDLWLDRSLLGRVFQTLVKRRVAEPRPAHEALTPAERRIVAEVVRHKSEPNKVIADALKISTHTLRNHLASIYAKLSLNRRLDLVLYAIERKLDHPSN